MRILILIVVLVLCAGCTHTKSKMDLDNVAVNIPSIELTLNTDLNLTDVELPKFAFPMANIDLPFRYLSICGGMRFVDEPKVINMTLEELKQQGALVQTSSYQKWIPIEGEPQTVLVFNFKN